MKLSSFKHALNGLILTFTKHPNIRFHTFAGTIALIASWALKLTHIEFIIILFTIALITTSEMINTSIESMVDLITLEYRQDAKIAKDVAAGMVLLNSFLAVVIGIIIFTPHIIDFFNHL